MFLTPDEFETHIYEETQNRISRNDLSKVAQALMTAEQIVGRYLSNYDTATIFASTASDKAKYQEIVMYVKDIAKWHFIAICNVSVDLELSERRYQFAVKELEKIQSGKTLLAGYPLATPDQEPKSFRSGSKPKFNHSL
jgi:hypothetical protein